MSLNSATKSAGDEVNYEDLLALAMQSSSRRIHLLPRSALYALLAAICHGGGSTTMSYLLQKSMLQRGIPFVLVRGELIAQQWLTGNPTSAAWETLRWLCSNRDKLLGRVENCFSLWGIVGGEGAFVDDQFNYEEEDSNQRWFSVWCIILVTTVVDVYFTLLAEADLLELDELDYFYWYWDYVLSTNVWAVNKLKDSKLALEVDVLKLRLQRQKQELHGDKSAEKPQIESSDAATKKSKKSKSKQKRAADRAAQGISASTSSTAASEEPTLPPGPRKPLAVELADLAPGPPDLTRLPERDPPSADEALLRAKALLCKGLFRGLLMLSDSPTHTSAVPFLLDKSGSRYTSREHKFEQRFKPLRCITNPPMLSYSDILATVAKLLANSKSNNVFESNAVEFAEDLPPGDDVVEEESFEAYVQRIAAATSGCFQTARKYLDESRKIANSQKGAPKDFEVTALSYTKVSVASTLSVVKLEKKVREWNSYNEGSASVITNSKIRLNRKYHSLFPVIEFD